MGLVSGCGSSPPTDQNFGTNLGADFRAPVTDASGDTNLTPDSGQGGPAGTTGQGTGGATGQGTGGAAGQSAIDAAAGFQVYADPAGHPFCLCWG